MELKLKRINLNFALALALALLCAPAGAALVNYDIAQPGISGTAAWVAEDFSLSVLRPEENAPRSNDLRAYAYRLSSDAVLHSVSLGITDRLTSERTHEAEAADVHGSPGGLVKVSVATVPEPVPLTFIGIGAIALVGIQALRRRRT
jgi:hypothetical protein